MGIIKKLIFILIFFIGANSQAAGFDCLKASTNVEKLICGSEVLNKLDEENTNLFNQIKNNQIDSSLLVNDQRNWLKMYRNICLDEKCLIDSYKSRNYVLENLIGSYTENTNEVNPKNTVTAQANLQNINDNIQANNVAVAPDTKDIENEEKSHVDGELVKNTNLELQPEIPVIPEKNSDTEMVAELQLEKPDAVQEANNFANPEQSETLSSEHFINSFGYPLNIILIGILIILPILLFLFYDSKYKSSNGCEKVRPIPSLAMLFLGLIIFMATEATDPALFWFSILLYLPAVRYFIIEAIGYVLDPQEGVIHLPGSTRDADSFLSYLNPMFLLSPFTRDKIEISSCVA